MASNTTPIKISIIADSRDAEKGIRKVDAELDGFGNKIKGASIGIAGALAATFAVGPIVSFGKEAVGLSSSVTESLNKVRSVFGDASGSIEDFADTAADQLGISRAEALKAAGGFGNMFDQLKIGTGVSADMSKGLLTLAADLGSFNNASNVEVIEAMTSAFRGEYDAVQRFVPTINAAAVQQKALEQTHKDSTAALTEADKALATYTLLMEGAGKAAGDFALTADDPANAWKRAQAQWENAKESLGTQLLPVLGEGARWLAEELPAALDTTERFFKSLDENGVQPAKRAFEDLQTLFESPEFQLALLSTRVQIEGIGVAIDGVQRQTNGFVETSRIAWSIWGEDVTGIVRDSIALAASLVDIGINGIKGSLQIALNVMTGDWRGAWNSYGQTAEGALQGANKAIGHYGDIMAGSLRAMGKLFSLATGGMFDGIPLAFAAAINRVIDKWNGLSFSVPSVEIFGQRIGGGSIETRDIPRFARGGVAPGDRPILVGEEGPELITLGRTSRVYNSRETAALTSQPSIHYAPVYNFGDIRAGDVDDIDRRLRQVLEEHDAELLELIGMGVSATAQEN